MNESITRQELLREGPFMIIKINQLYREGMPAEELYEITRGYWRLNVEHARKVPYVLAVTHGTVVEVYMPKEWYPAGTTKMTFRDAPRDPDHRYEFTGEIAPEKIRNEFLGRSVKELFSKGCAAPVTYFGI